MDPANTSAAPAAPSSANQVDAELDSIPLPGADNLSADQPGAGADTGAPGAAPLAAGEVTEEQARAAAAAHRPMVGMVITGIADTLLPNWKITNEECDKLAESFSLALGYWWPDGTVPPKWAATIMAAYTGYMIIRERRNDDGTWQPRKVIEGKRAAGAPREVTATAAKSTPGSGPGAGGEV